MIGQSSSSLLNEHSPPEDRQEASQEGIEHQEEGGDQEEGHPEPDE